MESSKIIEEYIWIRISFLSVWIRIENIWMLFLKAFHFHSDILYHACFVFQQYLLEWSLNQYILPIAIELQNMFSCFDWLMQCVFNLFYSNDLGTPIVEQELPLFKSF